MGTRSFDYCDLCTSESNLFQLVDNAIFNINRCPLTSKIKPRSLNQPCPLLLELTNLSFVLYLRYHATATRLMRIYIYIYTQTFRYKYIRVFRLDVFSNQTLLRIYYKLLTRLKKMFKRSRWITIITMIFFHQTSPKFKVLPNTLPRYQSDACIIRNISFYM